MLDIKIPEDDIIFFILFGKKQEKKIDTCKDVMSYDDIKNMTIELQKELDESHKRFLLSYVNNPEDLTFIWYYFIANIHNLNTEMIKDLEIFVNNKKEYNDYVIAKYSTFSDTILMDIFEGFKILVNISQKILDKIVNEEEIIEADREIYNIIDRITFSITYDSLCEKEEIVVFGLLSYS